MQMRAVLTVSESKRLIAKGIAKVDYVQKALKEGLVAIAKGTTNGYVVEEILGREIHKPDYCLGFTRPAKAEGTAPISGKIPDLVLQKGEPMDIAVVDVIRQMNEGDVFIKGANALNHERGQAALLVGHETGGTIGATIGCVIPRRIHCLIPVGLEKSVSYDLNAASERVGKVGERRGSISSLWVFSGHIFTEIEAIQTLTHADAFPIGAGGIGGAEGSVRLVIEGASEQIDLAAALIESVQGEPPFL